MPQPASCYEVEAGRLTSIDKSAPPASRLATLVHSQFRGAILSSAFPCLGGASAVRREQYWFAMYGALGSSEAGTRCATDLADFVGAFPASKTPVAVFVTVFAGALISSEQAFEKALWEHLRVIYEHDPVPDLAPFGPDGEADPGFYFAGRDFFIVGLHPAASRWSRRFAWPVLVFNALSHSLALADAGKTTRMRERILERDHLLQGSDNPALASPQLAQFSGAAPSPHWQCPVSFE